MEVSPLMHQFHLAGYRPLQNLTHLKKVVEGKRPGKYYLGGAEIGREPIHFNHSDGTVFSPDFLVVNITPGGRAYARMVEEKSKCGFLEAQLKYFDNNRMSVMGEHLDSLGLKLTSVWVVKTKSKPQPVAGYKFVNGEWRDKELNFLTTSKPPRFSKSRLAKLVLLPQSIVNR